jgi:hypothetical protein
VGVITGPAGVFAVTLALGSALGLDWGGVGLLLPTLPIPDVGCAD